MQSNQTLKVILTTEDAKLPIRAHANDAGLDVFSTNGATINPGSTYNFNTGLKLELPANTYGHLLTRSSYAKMGLLVVGGIIDQGYTGLVSVMLHNTSKQPVYIKAGAKVAQLIVTPYLNVNVEQVTTIADSQRGDNAFGSSGK